MNTTTRKEVLLTQPVYMKLRITTHQEVYDPTDEQNYKAADRYGPMKLRGMVEMLDEHGYIHSKMTSGYETKGKTGDWVKPHFHIHFDTMAKKDTIRKAITRSWEKIGDGRLSGNKMWSFQIEPYVVEDKFFCYPLKQAAQAPLANKQPSRGFNDDEMRAMTKAAAMTAAIAQDVAIKKGNKKEESDTLYDRLEAKLDEGQGTLAEIVRFYMDENRAINKVTVRGYYDLYRLKKGKITVEEYCATI